jgi:MATE family multidrug resistance protein
MSAPPLPFSRRLGAEVLATTVLALPLVLGQLSSMMMNVIDTVLAGRHSALTQAAVAIGTAVWSVAILIVIGVLMAIPPSVAQLDGAGRRREIGPLFRQALWLALLLGLLLWLFVGNAGWLLAFAGVADEVRPQALGFLKGVAPGAPALALFFAFRYLSEGVSLTVPTMVIGIGGLFLLLPLGYALMFGTFGAPELGALGLGVATACVLWIQALAYGLHLHFSPRYADLGLYSQFDWPRWAPIAELLKIGLPMGFSIFMEGSLFVATALIIGSLGTLQTAAHQVAINLASVAFMIPLGVAMATTVRVGNAMGRGDPAGVGWAGGAGYVITAFTQFGSALVLLFGASTIAALWTKDAAVAALAVQLMVLAAAFQFSDGLQAASAGALRGLKDTRVPAVVTVLSYWGLGMPLGYWMGIVEGGGAHGMWYGLIMGLSAAALLLTIRFVILARRLRRTGQLKRRPA